MYFAFEIAIFCLVLAVVCAALAIHAFAKDVGLLMFGATVCTNLLLTVSFIMFCIGAITQWIAPAFN